MNTNEATNPVYEPANLSRYLDDRERWWNQKADSLANSKGLRGKDKVEWMNRYLREIHHPL